MKEKFVKAHMQAASVYAQLLSLIHISEPNAIAKVSRSTNSSEGASIFITHAPCLECAKIIYQAGIKEVYYQHNYRSMAGIEFLKQCDIDVQQVEGV